MERIKVGRWRRGRRDGGRKEEVGGVRGCGRLKRGAGGEVGHGEVNERWGKQRKGGGGVVKDTWGR